MLVNKITTGFVIQTFDTEKKRFVSQEFVAGDQVDYEHKEGEPCEPSLLEVDGKEAVLAFEMKQPQVMSQPVKIVIEVKGGVVVAVHASRKDVEVVLLDWTT
jgi:hypothetical protein